MNEGFKSLNAYKLAYKLAMEIFNLTKTFPKEEKLTLTDQIRRSSLAVCKNIGEGYLKRKHPEHLSGKIMDAEGECSETMIWLEFSKYCNYISLEKYNELHAQYIEVGKMLGAMIGHPHQVSTSTYQA